MFQAVTGEADCDSPADTRDNGRQFGRFFPGKPTDYPSLILLSGSLGAGKTLWAGGFADGLGMDVEVHSPSFTLLNIYHDKKMILNHFDIYRLNCFEEIFDIGLMEILEEKNPCIIEWADRIPDLLRLDHLAITFSITETDRRKLKWRVVRKTE